MLPVIKILLSKDTPLRAVSATGSSPADVHDPAPTTRVSVEDSMVPLLDPPETR